MNDLIKVLEQYKIFNYLVPGVLFAYLIGNGSWFAQIQNMNTLIAFVILYFVGSVVSRVGSLFVEPTLKKLGVLKFEDYSNYIDASKKDKKIELLSQENNVYRTYIAVFLAVFLFNIAQRFLKNGYVNARESNEFFLLMLALMLLFILSYRKQTNYITARIKKQK